MLNLKRTLVLAVGGLLASAAISLAVATPAQATGSTCMSYLAGEGFPSDTAIKRACTEGDRIGGKKGEDYCKSALKVRGGIPGDVAAEACARAIR